MPCVIIVDSSAKTGLPATKEDSTSAERCFSLTIQNIHWVNFNAVLLKDHEKN
tara:strand:- start:543 stop:701 length:159 start_codon:yes stop_codon:yes gene_type:complete